MFAAPLAQLVKIRNQDVDGVGDCDGKDHVRSAGASGCDREAEIAGNAHRSQYRH